MSSASDSSLQVHREGRTVPFGHILELQVLALLPTGPHAGEHPSLQVLGCSYACLPSA